MKNFFFVIGMAFCALVTADLLSRRGFGQASPPVTFSVTNCSGCATSASPVLTGNGSIAGAWSIGTNPALSGGLRLGNASAITIRNFANSGDLGIMDTTSADIMRFAYSNIVTLQTNATNLAFGGVANTNPMLVRSTTTLQNKLGDGSAFTFFQSKYFSSDGSTGSTSATCSSFKDGICVAP